MSKYGPLLELGYDVRNDILPLIGDVDRSMYERFIFTITTLSNLGKELDELTILLSTDGGNPDYAFAIYDQLRNMPGKVRVVCNGSVSSAGTIILMAGDERIMTEHSVLMFHYGSNESTCQNDSDNIDYWHKKYNDLFFGVTDVTEEIIREWYKTNVYYTPEQARKLNLITGITNGKKPKAKRKKRATRTRR